MALNFSFTSIGRPPTNKQNGKSKFARASGSVLHFQSGPGLAPSTPDYRNVR
jgi:hypothetical protein